MALNIGDLIVQISANIDGLKNAKPAIKELADEIQKLAKVEADRADSVKKLEQKIAKYRHKSWQDQFKNQTDINKKLISNEEKAIKARTSEHKAGWKEIVLNEERTNKLRIQQAIETNKRLTAEGELAFRSFRRQMSDYQTTARQSAEVFKEAFRQAEVHGITTELNHLGDGFVTMGTRARGASNRLSGTTSKVRNLGLGVQNAAYQFQDMIVQFEMGIDTSRILAQQLPQLFSGFGVVGSVIGLAAAALATFIPLLSNLGKKSEKTSKDVDVYKSSLEDLKRITDNLEESQANLNGTIGDFKLKSFNAAVATSLTGVTDIEQKIKDLNKLRDTPAGKAGAFKPGGKYAQQLKALTDQLKEAQDKLIESTNDLNEARTKLNQTTINNIQTDLNEYNSLIKLAKSYENGEISLKKYQIQKELIQEANRKGIKEGEKAYSLLEKEIRAKYKLKEIEDKLKPKSTSKEQKNTTKLIQSYKDLKINLSQATAVLQTMRTEGILAGTAINKEFDNQKIINKYTDSLERAGNEATRALAKFLGIPQQGRKLADIINDVAKAMGNVDIKTKDANESISFLKQTLTDVRKVMQEISTTKDISIADRIANPDAIKRLIDLRNSTSSWADKINESLSKGNKSAIQDTINAWQSVADQLGQGDIFKSIDVTSANAVNDVAAAVARLNQLKVEGAALDGGIADFVRGLKEEAETAGLTEKGLMEYNLQKIINAHTSGKLTDAQQKEIDKAKELADQYYEEAKAAKRFKEASDEMGQAIGSALEDAIVNGAKLSDVLKGLEKQILSIFTKKFISAPIAEALGGAFGGASKGQTSASFLGNLAGTIGNILHFDGGGFTGLGPRVGGVDGKGGFLSIMHPQETVIDHTKSNNAAIGGPPIINFNVYAQDVNSFRASQRQVSQDLRNIVSGAGL